MVKAETEQKREDQIRLRKFAREMRRLPTETERKFWTCVRGRRFAGYKFRRQVAIGNYIADYVCASHKLIVEIDGGEHETRKRYDRARDVFLESQGYRVLRFETWQVTADIESVLQMVKHALDATTPSPRPPPPEGEREK
jgi:very-short-patch-repair endonuclease